MSNNCLDYKNIKLHDYQKLPSYFILNPLNRGLLVFYNLGTGKSLVSITMCRCLLNKYPNKNVIVLTPASLVSNYEKGIVVMQARSRDHGDLVRGNDKRGCLSEAHLHRRRGDDARLACP